MYGTGRYVGLSDSWSKVCIETIGNAIFVIGSATALSRSKVFMRGVSAVVVRIWGDD